MLGQCSGRLAMRFARAFVVVLATLAARPVLAQAPAATEQGRTRAAQAAFVEGVRALEEGRYVDARDALRRSLALLRAASTAFNLGIAYRETGELTRALALFDALLGAEYGALDAAREAQVRLERDATRRRLATVQVDVGGPSPDRVELRIDGERVDGLLVRADPGVRIVRVSADGYEPEERTIDVAQGARRTLRLELEPEPETTLWESPWLYAGIGGALLAAAGVIVLVASDRSPDRFDNPLFDGAVQTLGGAP